MGFNIGAFAGGASRGIGQGISDVARVQAMKRIKDQQDAQASEQQTLDGITQQVQKADLQRRMLQTPAADPAQAVPAAAQGIAPAGAAPAGAPLAAAGIPAQAPLQNAADMSGSTSDAAPIPADPNNPHLRAMNADDRFQMANDTFDGLLKHGLYDQAAKLAPMRQTLLADKLQQETQLRSDAAGNAISALNSGDDKSLLTATKQLSDLIPDGHDVNSIKRDQDGNLVVSYGDRPAVTLTPDQFKQSIVSMVDWKQALTYDNQNQQLQLKKHADQMASDKNSEDKRHNIAMEGIDRSKANSTKSGTTAEITNVQYLLDNKIAKTPAEAWEMVTTGKTPAGDKVSPDGMGGVIVSNPRTGQIAKFNGSGQEQTIRPGKDAQGGSIKKGDVVDGYKFNGGDPNISSNWEKQ